jgi:hypothetical protein
MKYPKTDTDKLAALDKALALVGTPVGRRMALRQTRKQASGSFYAEENARPLHSVVLAAYQKFNGPSAEGD